MVRCGSLSTKARIRPRSCQTLTLHQALFASASASAPRLPSDFIACSMAATASVKNSSRSPGSLSRSRVTTMTGMTISFLRGPQRTRSSGLAPGRVEVGAWVLVGQPVAGLSYGRTCVFLDSAGEPAQRDEGGDGHDAGHCEEHVADAAGEVGPDELRDGGDVPVPALELGDLRGLGRRRGAGQALGDE